jgi:hypothetical protein
VPPHGVLEIAQVIVERKRETGGELASWLGCEINDRFLDGPEFVVRDYFFDYVGGNLMLLCPVVGRGRERPTSRWWHAPASALDSGLDLGEPVRH